MSWEKIKGVVASVAPALATAFGGPLAGIAAAAVSDALVGKPNATEAEVVTALQAGGAEALIKLKEADNKFRLDMERLGIDLERIHQEDRSSARDREVKSGDSWTPRILAGLVVSAWIAVQWFLLNNIVPGEMRELVARVLGTLDAALTMVLAYYFGSSAGSREKTQIMGRQTASQERP